MIVPSPADLWRVRTCTYTKIKHLCITEYVLPLVSSHTDMLTVLHSHYWGRCMQTFPSLVSGGDDWFFYRAVLICICSCCKYVCVSAVTPNGKVKWSYHLSRCIISLTIIFKHHKLKKKKKKIKEVIIRVFNQNCNFSLFSVEATDATFCNGGP